MKKIIPILICLVFIGCTEEKEHAKTNNTVKLSKFASIRTIEYDGHEYILYSTGVGSSITHKENCKFHN